MTIGERIKLTRKLRGMSAETLAEKLNVAPSTIYRYEKGEIMKVSTDAIPPIAKALMVTPAYLMGWEESEENDSMLIRINDLAGQLNDENRHFAAEILEGLLKRQ